MDHVAASYWVYALGFFGQALFGARLIVQLYLSEKAGKVVSPTAFWLLSLGASLLFLFYGFLREDRIIIVGQTLSYYIYLRNLHLKMYWQSLNTAVQVVLLIIPISSIFFWVISRPASASSFFETSMLFHPVMLAGAIGQLALNLRFVYQWWYSEKHNTSLLPLGFWHISVWASVLVLIYAGFHPVHQFDPVLLVAQGFGIVVYIRNVILHQRNAESKGVT
jgi:lipid-A-disaccharide synthase-like uncharacterized protein